MWLLNDPQFSPTPHPAFFLVFTERDETEHTSASSLCLGLARSPCSYRKGGGGRGSLLSRLLILTLLKMERRQFLYFEVKASVFLELQSLPTKLPSFLLAKAEVLALSLLSSSAIFVLSRRAAVAAKHR